MMGANFSSQATAIDPFDDYTYFTNSSSVSLSDSINGIVSMGEISKALMDADEVEKRRLASNPTTWIGRVRDPVSLLI